MGKGRLLTVVFIVWIFAFSLAGFLLPDTDFSESENRFLTQLPAFSLESLLSGRFTSDFESYLNDQFVGRDLFVTISEAMRFGVGLRETGEVYVCANGALVQKTNRLEQEQAERNARLVGAFAQSAETPVVFALIPDAAELLASLLPAGAPHANERALIDALYTASGANEAYAAVKTADILGALCAREPAALYYRTDHHWTSLGAYYGYAALSEVLGFAPTALSDYAPETVSTDFYGTLYSKAPLWWLQPDSIERYAPEAGITVASYGGAQQGETGLYVPENLAKKDQYTYFLGGNAPRVVVKTAVKDAPRLLILRDSFADSAVPFLAAHFSELHLLDARYYKLPLSAYMEENGIDLALVLYSVKTFCEDTNLPLVLE